MQLYFTVNVSVRKVYLSSRNHMQALQVGASLKSNICLL